MLSNDEPARQHPINPDPRLTETEAILDTLPYPTFAINDRYAIIRLNRAALQHSGSGGYATAIGTSCYRLIYHRESPCPYCPFDEEPQDDSLSESDPHDRLIQIPDENGEERTYRLSFYRISSKRIQLVETLEDITLQREKQEEALRIENLAALGTMISGIVHELNNPLTGIGLTLQNLEANLATMETDEVKKRLTILRKDLNRASRIVSDILSFSRPGEIRLTPSDITQTIQRAQANIIRLYPVLSRRVEWTIKGDENVILPIHPEKIERLFINLFRNSIQAMDYSPGSIAVEVKKSRKFVHILVEDNAGGIKSDDIKKIFNPFYTSSRDGRGSGLGLTICHSIVKEHSGRIGVRSSAGFTRFYITLPMQKSSDRV